MNNKLHTLVVILVSMLGQIAIAQGTLKGRITEVSDATEGVAFANIILEGTQIGTTSDLDGYYEISAPAGVYTIQASFIGYNSCTQKNVNIEDDAENTLNLSMSESSMELDVINLVAKADRESESAILVEQKNATEIVQAIGAKELSKKGLSDVASAVTKVTGISKQEGSSGVFVRGLGDRYNSTTFNNLPLPSNNPANKNISLGLFNTDIVQVIGINKIFGSTIYGDLGGANINIESKVHDGDPYLNVKVGTSLSTAALGTSDFLMQDGPNASGFYNPSFGQSNLTRDGFATSWDAKTQSPIAYNFAINGGRTFEFKNESVLNVFATLSHNTDYAFIEGQSKAGINKTKEHNSEYDFKKYSNSTNTTGMLNLDYVLNSSNELKYNALFINSSNQKVEDYDGMINRYDIAEFGGGFIRRQTFDRTSLLVNQLLGNHELNNNLKFDWGVANNYVKNIIPDRKQNTFVPQNSSDIDGPKIANDLSQSDNHRYFQELTEIENAVNTSLKYSFYDGFDNDHEIGFLEVGYSGRFKNVGFEATQFNLSILEDDLSLFPIADLNNIDGYFTSDNFGSFYETKTFRGDADDANALDPQTYDGKQFIHAGYGKGQYELNSLLTMSAGLRFESIYQQVEWKTAIDPAGGEELLNATKVLPSVSLKYSMNETDNLKFGFSQSYTLPQYKERARFQFEDVTTVYIGNPDLYASDNFNFDLKWESFPAGGKTMYSATAYGKLIKNPINNMMIASAANDFSYLNTGEEAKVAGIEAEFNQQILDFSRNKPGVKNNLTLNINASWMVYSNQDLDNDKVSRETNLGANFTETETGLTGASDLLLNTDIMYFVQKEEHKNFLATLSFGYFSDRIVSIGTASRGNMIDNGFVTMNLTLKTQLNERVKLSLSAKNLLDPTITRVQEIQDVEVLNYKKGRFFGLSLTYMM